MRACLNNEDLGGLKLSNVDLSYASLRFTNLSSSELTNVDLHHVDLTGTNLSNSTIDSCDLKGIKASIAKFRNSKINNIDLFCTFLCGSDFYQTILTNTDMTDIDAMNGLFVGVDLSSNVVLTRALFSKADLSYADLSNTILLSTNFTNACLKLQIFKIQK